MRKVIISLLLILSVVAVNAQKKNVAKAKNLSLMEVPDFKGARDAIAPALLDSVTSKMPLTWYTAAQIGYKENEAFYKELMLGKQVDFVKKGTAVMESINYFLKTYELDQKQVDKKGKPVKPKYEKAIKDAMKEFYTDKTNLFYYGATLFDEKKDYVGAIKAFDTFMMIPELPFMAGLLTKDSTYFQVKYYTALAARNAGLIDRAIAIHEDMKDDGHETMFVYQLLYDEYVQKKDTANFVKTLKEGFDLMPKEPWFLQNLINFYLLNNYIDESKQYITKAIDMLPDVAVYHYVKAKIDEAEKKSASARASYEKTLELDPKFADAYAGIGALIIEDGQKILDDAAYKSDKEFVAAKKKAKEVFKNALTYFLKANELSPDEQAYKRNLRLLYYRLEMTKELEAIEKQLGY
jgi:tetratricopeptide (TPR) repeat protein